MSLVGEGRPLVSVVIPTYHRRERCLRLLRALADQTLDPGDFEVLAVDNGSSDGTTAMLQGFCHEAPYHLRPLRIDINRGPAAARNLGWRSAGASVIAFTDDDCVPQPNWLAAGLATVHADERIGVAQGRTTAPAGVDVDDLPPWWHHQTITGPTHQFEACNVFYRRQALEQSGGFDEDIGWWGEDASAGWQVLEAGWARCFSADAGVVHDVTARGLGWNLRNGLLERNMVRLAARHPGFRAAAFWRPWAFRQADAAFILAVAGAVAATHRRLALVAVLPYLWCRRPGSWSPQGLRTSCECVPVDAARAIGQIWGAIRYRVAVV